MNKFLNEWIFINYCGQKIGQFDYKDIRGYMLNVFNAQVGHFLNIIVLNFYIFLGFRNLIGFIFLLIIDNIIVRHLIKKIIMPYVSINELEQEYIKTTRQKRILNFIISIILVIVSFLLFAFSFLIQGILK